MWPEREAPQVPGDGQAALYLPDQGPGSDPICARVQRALGCAGPQPCVHLGEPVLDLRLAGGSEEAGGASLRGPQPPAAFLCMANGQPLPPTVPCACFNFMTRWGGGHLPGSFWTPDLPNQFLLMDGHQLQLKMNVWQPCAVQGH